MRKISRCVNNLFKIFLVLAMFLNNLCLVPVSASYSADITASLSGYRMTWNFSDDIFSDIDTIQNNRKIANLSFHANAVNDMYINYHRKVINGIVYTHRLQLRGMGDINERSISFDVLGDTKVYVTTKSSGDDHRILNVSDSDGTIVGTIPAKPDADTYCFDYTGGATELYLFSNHSGINIYAVSIVGEYPPVTTINKNWRFDDSRFSNLGTISNETKIDGLSIVPNAYMSGKATKIGGDTYTNALELHGSGHTESNNVNFEVPGDCYIQVTSRSNVNEQRELLVVNEAGYLIGSIPAYEAATINTVKYTGPSDNIYIYSKHSAILLYNISVTSAGGNNEATSLEDMVVNSDVEDIIASQSSVAIELPSNDIISTSSISIDSVGK